MKRGRPTSRSEPINAWLGREICLEGGELRFDGCLRLDGEVISGSLTGPSLVVGEGGRVTGRLAVGRLTVYGRVEAEAVVAEEVWVAEAGSFQGELRLATPRLVVEEGAVFEARVRVDQPIGASQESR